MPRLSMDGDEDPQGNEKDKDERKLARTISGILADQYSDLIDNLDTDEPSDPGADFWERWGVVLLAAITPFLISIGEKSAQGNMQGVGIGVAWDDVQDAVEQWASAYSFRLVSDITNTSRNALRAQLANFYSGQLDYDALTTILQNRYGPVRAAMISATETQRGYEMGLNIYEDQLRRLGVQTDRQWFVEDQDACPLCLPNNKKLRNRDGWTQSGIPAHPNCRCWSEVVTLDNQGRII